MEPPVPPDPLSASESAESAATRAARDAALGGLYVHVPFCVRRCAYCDFSTGSLSGHGVERYLAAMAREVEARAPMAAGFVFHSVFFGGGTPSALPSRAFRSLARTLRSAFSIAPGAEITLEANPESVRPVLLDAWSAAGVNRLSIGVQSFDPAELRTLDRVHDAATAARALRLARAHGFERRSLDLMFGFPGHRAATWRRTLETALALEPEHVSAYCFIPEPGTPMGDAVRAGSQPLPGPERQAELYRQATAMLEGAGYRCYETSNFCRPGGEARHNLVYWLVRPYLGLGPSAHGCFGGVRYGNHHGFSRWATALERGLAPEASRETPDRATRALEVMMLGLRLAGGLDRRDHAGRAWDDLLAHQGAAFAAAVAAGRLEPTARGWRVPARHRFVADDVLAWIAARAARPAVDSAAERSITLMPCPSLPSPVA